MEKASMGLICDIIVGDEKLLQNFGGNPLENINYEDKGD
jgi:hypothetical protein